MERATNSNHNQFRNNRESHDPSENLVDCFKSLAEEANEGLIIIDKNGYVVYSNRRHAEYLKISQEDALYAHITKITTPELAKGFLTVLSTGKPELRKVFQFHERQYIANQVPVRRGERIIGVAGIILFDAGEIDVLNTKIKSLEKHLEFYKNQVHNFRSTNYSFEDVLGKGPLIKAAIEEGKRAAGTDANVLLLGESGTGKELFAQAIHNQSRRKFGPFVRVNCSAIPQELVEAEFFGYEPGSFTGGLKTGKKGKFELAHNGSIFLDEIGDMPQTIQGSLLRVLQEKEIERIGGSKSIKVDFRLIAATHRDLLSLVEKGSFRQDLFFRINVVKIQLPPLREMKRDLPMLLDIYLNQKAMEFGIGKISLSPSALKLIENYHFPGNVRELKNIVERVLSRIEPEKFDKGPVTLSKEDLYPALDISYYSEQPLLSWNNLKQSKHDREIQTIKEVIVATGGNMRKCAKMLGIHRTGLYRKIRLYNLYEDISLARRNTIQDLVCKS